MNNWQDREAVCRKDAALYLREMFGLRVSTGWLARRTADGSGPPYRRFGKQAIYPVPELRAWALAAMGPEIRRARDVSGAAAGVRCERSEPDLD